MKRAIVLVGTVTWFTWWLFLTLRLVGADHWSWWWVTAPLWVIMLGFTVAMDVVLNVINGSLHEIRWHK